MTLEEEFHSEMLSGVDILKREENYHASRYMQMVQAQGGLAAAKLLLANPKAQTGLHDLCLLKRLELSMEAAMILSKYRALFSEEERGIAQKRLYIVGYDTRARKPKAAHD